jgi:hypothetical protein
MKIPISSLALVSLSLMTFSLQSALGEIYLTSGQNLIQYGSFQTWSETLQYWGGTYGRPNVVLNDADGDGGLVMLIDQTPMFQTVPTIAGTTYQLIFASRAPLPPEFNGPMGPHGPIGPWQVNVYINNARAGVFENDSQTIWRYFSMDFVATGPTTLGFGATANEGWSLFDDVSLVAVAEPSVPAYCALILVVVSVCRTRDAKAVFKRTGLRTSR